MKQLVRQEDADVTERKSRKSGQHRDDNAAKIKKIFTHNIIHRIFHNLDCSTCTLPLQLCVMRHESLL